MSSYIASFLSLSNSRYRRGLGLRNLQMSSLINFLNDTEPFLGTYDS